MQFSPGGEEGALSVLASAEGKQRRHVLRRALKLLVYGVGLGMVARLRRCCVGRAYRNLALECCEVAAAQSLNKSPVVKRRGLPDAGACVPCPGGGGQKTRLLRGVGRD